MFGSAAMREKYVRIFKKVEESSRRPNNPRLLLCWYEIGNSDMDEIPTPALENRSRHIIPLSETSSRLETLDQMGDGCQAETAFQEGCDGCQAECLATAFEEFSLRERSAVDLGFQVEAEEEFDVEMHGDLWGELPANLIDSIVAKLPLLSFLRLRSVCRRWNNLVSDPLFLEHCPRTQTASEGSAPPFFILYADRARQSYPTYDPALNAWYLLPPIGNSSPPGESSTSFVLLASAGGLLCLSDALSGSEEDLSLYVSNPITKARRRLPPIIQMPSPYVVGMVVDSVKNSYQILVALGKKEHVKVQVYDSASNSWQMTGNLPERLALLVGAVYVRGVVYCLAFRAVSFGVLGYHIESGIWDYLGAPMPPFLVWPTLFVSRGHLMVVGAISSWGPVERVSVWQLDSMQMEWVEVLRMPEDLRLELTRGDRAVLWDAAYLFVADEDHICFFRYRVKQMLMCNVFKKSWWWLPPSPFDTYVDTLNCQGFPLQPNLVTSV